MFRGWLLIGILALCAPSCRASSTHQEFSDFTTPLPLKTGDTLVLGIVGGWERWDAPQRGVRKTALELRAMNLPGVYVETVENHSLNLAAELIARAFPGDSVRSARVILYGHSFGGMSAVRFARDLEAKRIPVLLLILIDAVGRNRPIPPNVHAAANFYQRDSFPVCGPKRIRAQDPASTRILGNVGYSYWRHPVDISMEPWVRRFFVRGHEMMEFDPQMWSAVKKMITTAVRGETTGAPPLP
jgi:pimeloyl-ACP methyl ester carboxylesterase